jgi:hypothetical protein
VGEGRRARRDCVADRRSRGRRFEVEQADGDNARGHDDPSAAVSADRRSRAPHRQCRAVCGAGNSTHDVAPDIAPDIAAANLPADDTEDRAADVTANFAGYVARDGTTADRSAGSRLTSWRRDGDDIALRLKLGLRVVVLDRRHTLRVAGFVDGG